MRPASGLVPCYRPGPPGACAILAGRDDYELRAQTVEPVFGQLKACQKVTMTSGRGLAACENEWLLAWAAYNVRKLHRHRAQG